MPLSRLRKGFRPYHPGDQAMEDPGAPSSQTPCRVHWPSQSGCTAPDRLRPDGGRIVPQCPRLWPVQPDRHLSQTYHPRPVPPCTYFLPDTAPAAHPPHTASRSTPCAADHVPEPGTVPCEVHWTIPGFPESQRSYPALPQAWYTGRNQNPRPRSSLLCRSHWKGTAPAPLSPE